MRHELENVAAAALAWNRARLHRIAVTKQNADALRWATVPEVNDARKAEATAKARLRKACAAADPGSLTIDAEVRELAEAPGVQIWRST
ncbi:hypothetical protein [Alicycliphilus denitrificans]|uniref:Uncharacterized protein n=1 Tax=Alicycliphilus denitrificans (strain DSM 14773 / CIP 107495 / K601) TaxID=596154 RepID=F4G7I9_ALIDK|nr:hypothetical protein [Alicycliphilus denitrificans]AEB85519.1 hypothetical protein Alide2_3178 [Alicycliphilus denitrificans K601]